MPCAFPTNANAISKIDKINPGEWFANQFAPMIKAEKVLVQKSGYFARSAPANAADRKLIQDCASAAVQAALAGISGLVGPDEDQGDVIRVCEFQRVAGGKPFDTEQLWFEQLLSEIGQPKGKSFLNSLKKLMRPSRSILGPINIFRHLFSSSF
jgi:pyrophosphate--fructose-6-phosphate 1-phosphotransferase